jgi:hypothetical protein
MYSPVLFGIGTRARVMSETRSLPRRRSCNPWVAQSSSRVLASPGSEGLNDAIFSFATANDVHTSKMSSSVRSVSHFDLAATTSSPMRGSTPANATKLPNTRTMADPMESMAAIVCAILT